MEYIILRDTTEILNNQEAIILRKEIQKIIDKRFWKLKSEEKIEKQEYSKDIKSRIISIKKKFEIAKRLLSEISNKDYLETYFLTSELIRDLNRSIEELPLKAKEQYISNLNLLRENRSKQLDE